MLVLDEIKGKGIKLEISAQPHEAGSADIEVWLKGLGIFAAHRAVDAVGGDDQVRIG